MTSQPDLPTALTLTTRVRTIAELPPQMSARRMLVNGAVGQSDDGYTTLTISDDTAQLLAEILIRYNSAATEKRHPEEIVQLRVDDDHDVAFWDQLACDLLVALEIPPPKTTSTLVYSLGKTADLGRRDDR